MAAMEQQMGCMLATVETMRAKLEASEEKYEELKQELGDVKIENTEFNQKVAELEARVDAGQRARPDSPDNGNRPEAALVDGSRPGFGGQETREAFEELPAEQQRDIIGMIETGSLAFSSLSPEIAAAVFGLSLYVPALRDKFGDIVHKWRRKD